jgi:signal transduction histidine kinase
VKKILLIDDSEHDRTLYKRFLRKHLDAERLTFSEASTGEEARAQFLLHRPDCVLLDYALPDTNGLELLAELLGLAPPESVCVVMVTGAGSEWVAVHALNEGALDYLVKQHFDHELLFKTMWHAIEKNEWRQYVARYYAELRAVNEQRLESLTALTASRQETTRKNDQLMAANAELARTNQDLDNFVYAASHDLKQPVNNLRGLFDELRRTATFHDPEEAHVLRLVDASLLDLTTTIFDLAAVVQEERPNTDQATETVVLAELLADVMLALRPQILTAQARIDHDFDALPALSYVRANLRTILFNLLANTLKYHAPTCPVQVQLRAFQDAGQPVLEVQDNGLGIDLARYGLELFQLFRRFHPEAAPGTGVGLFLVNRLVQSRGGRIEVTSREGHGTTFRLYLQAAEVPAHITPVVAFA